MGVLVAVRDAFDNAFDLFLTVVPHSQTVVVFFEVVIARLVEKVSCTTSLRLLLQFFQEFLLGFFFGFELSDAHAVHFSNYVLAFEACFFRCTSSRTDDQPFFVRSKFETMFPHKHSFFWFCRITELHCVGPVFGENALNGSVLHGLNADPTTFLIQHRFDDTAPG